MTKLRVALIHYWLVGMRGGERVLERIARLYPDADIFTHVYDPQAVSPKGATGLMQLIPGTAARYGVKRIADPGENVNGGTRYLRDLLNLFNGNLTLALAGYNAGEAAVQRYRNTVPPFPETQAYVRLVMQFYEYFGGGLKKIEAAPRSRIRVTLPPARRNFPPEGVAVPQGMVAEPQAPAAFALEQPRE